MLTSATHELVHKRTRLSFMFVIALMIAVAGLLGLSYRSLREWGRSTEMLAEGRVEAMLALLAGAINRDIKGTHVSVLLPLELEDVTEDPPYDLRDTFARASARFQYPESFFVATRKMPGQYVTHLFNRVDRLPPWDRPTDAADVFPVGIKRDAEEAQPLFEAIAARASRGSRFVVLDWTRAGTSYQVVAKFFYGGAEDRPDAFVGFTVNLDWVERYYFAQILNEVSRIGGGGESIGLMVVDPHGRQIASTTTIIESAGPVRSREFLFLFFDPAMLSSLAPGTSRGRPWKARVGIADDRVFIGALRATRWTYGILAVAAVTSVVAMLLTARAVRVHAELAMMQADFVSTVTHELKTPLQLIRLVAETLAMGRYKSAETVREYSRLLSQEVARLNRLIDNLLTLARVSDMREQYTFEALDVADLIEDALEGFRPRLDELGFHLTVEIPQSIPPMRGDREALHQVLDNLVDNAIKYSAEERYLSIRGSVSNGAVAIDVTDRGIGIAAEDVPRVFDKFYRGRPARSGSGSGLGLSIVKRIVEDHHGSIEVTSVPGQGTSVRLLIPAEPVAKRA